MGECCAHKVVFGHGKLSGVTRSGLQALKWGIGCDRTEREKKNRTEQNRKKNRQAKRAVQGWHTPADWKGNKAEKRRLMLLLPVTLYFTWIAEECLRSPSLYVHNK